ncbi:nuclear cap-binding protein subunit 2-like isoform X2 [Zea mays]|uniref:Nuclear cap-binding protein subunit 2 n=1 Tax=Zea mays TaxID=4577 RepID=C0PA70_MAIZE|nr:uncharacterized protein LOC100283725 isoform X2 [Zea mays]ACN31065.1 unknown [Zea mays]
MRQRCMRRQRCTLGICPSTPRRSRPTSSSPALARSRRSSWGSTRTLRPHAVSASYYSREDAEDAVKYISGTMLDDRPIRVDFDWGFEEGRQWGRGRSGGQVRDEYRTDYDPGRGGYGKMVQRELEAQRELVDYGGSFQPNAPPPYERGERKRGYGDSHRNDRGDYQRKRYRSSDDRSAPEESKRAPDSDPAEKNPRFREKGDSDEEEDDYDKRRRR